MHLHPERHHEIRVQHAQVTSNSIIWRPAGCMKGGQRSGRIRVERQDSAWSRSTEFEDAVETREARAARAHSSYPVTLGAQLSNISEKRDGDGVFAYGLQTSLHRSISTLPGERRCCVLWLPFSPLRFMDAGKPNTLPATMLSNIQ
jgi:hypothetical protein